METPLSAPPSLNRMLLELLGCLVIFELMFYHSHRLLHSSVRLFRFHRAHHAWRAPVAAATGCHLSRFKYNS